MSNRFAHLRVEEDNDQAPSISTGKDSPATKSRLPKKRSTNFTWRVLTESTLNTTAPRGLVNRSNFCYLNAVLQPLLLCQPFVTIVGNLKDRATADMPFLSAFGQLVNDFTVSPDNKRAGPINPDYVYRCWEHSDDQEDAEEFLRLILNSLHEELLRHRETLQWTLPSLKVSDNSSPLSNEQGNSEWLSVVGKQRTALSRTVTEPDTPISVCFSGRFKSVVRGVGQKESHVFEPFQFLPVDVSSTNCNNLLDAIKAISAPERITGSSKPLTKQLLIDRVPPTLVIHLKRFIFDPSTRNIAKSLTDIPMPDMLDLSGLVTNTSDSVFFAEEERPLYRLFAVVYHGGRTTHGGHYTCHVCHNNTWYYCDDSLVSPAHGEKIGATERHRTPYLLFYQRIKQ